MSSRIPATPLAWLVFPIALVLLAVACAPADSADGDSSVAAHIDGAPVTVAELDVHIKDQLFQQASQGGDASMLHQMRSQALEQLIQERLLADLANERGLTREELLDEEVPEVAVDEAEVLAFYEQNKSRMGGRSLGDVSGEIQTFLTQKNRAEAQQKYVAALREKATVSVALQAPRIAVEATGASKGPADAPVTIIEFSDYACPYCKRAEPIVEQILERYPDDVRFVYRHFPLESIHPQAFGAAEAAICAGEQDQFWAYHDLLFEHSPKHAPEALKDYAKKAGLDSASFDQCLAEQRGRKGVQADLLAGQGAGVPGTPAFFVNGLSMSGSRSLEEFVAVIEQELAAPPADEG